MVLWDPNGSHLTVLRFQKGGELWVRIEQSEDGAGSLYFCKDGSRWAMGGKFASCPKSLCPPAREKFCRTEISNKSCKSNETLYAFIVSCLFYILYQGSYAWIPRSNDTKLRAVNWRNGERPYLMWGWTAGFCIGIINWVMSLTTAGELLNIPASVSFSIAWNLCYLLTLISILFKKGFRMLGGESNFSIQDKYSPIFTRKHVCINL